MWDSPKLTLPLFLLFYLEHVSCIKSQMVPNPKNSWKGRICMFLQALQMTITNNKKAAVSLYIAEQIILSLRETKDAMKWKPTVILHPTDFSKLSTESDLMVAVSTPLQMLKGLSGHDFHVF